MVDRDPGEPVSIPIGNRVGRCDARFLQDQAPTRFLDRNRKVPGIFPRIVGEGLVGRFEDRRGESRCVDGRGPHRIDREDPDDRWWCGGCQRLRHRGRNLEKKQRSDELDDTHETIVPASPEQREAA
jgi:hypothetical protein